MLGTSPVAPRKNGLVETRGCKLEHLYETDEQSSQIATTFHNQLKILGHMIHLLSI